MAPARTEFMRNGLMLFQPIDRLRVKTEQIARQNAWIQGSTLGSSQTARVQVWIPGQ